MMFVRLTLALALTALFGASMFAQSDSAKTQAVFTADQLEERCAAAFKRYERFESSGRLLEDGSTGVRVWVEIADSLRHELSAAITGYLKAVDSGWESSDAGLVQARGKIDAVHARMKEIGVWTCFRWEDASLPAAARDGLDKIRTPAWEGALLVELGRHDDGAASFWFARRWTPARTWRTPASTRLLRGRWRKWSGSRPRSRASSGTCRRAAPASWKTWPSWPRRRSSTFRS